MGCIGAVMLEGLKLPLTSLIFLKLSQPTSSYSAYYFDCEHCASYLLILAGLQQTSFSK